MVQESWPWPGTVLGDAGPYSDDDWDNMWETLYGSGVAPYGNRGVIRNWLNELKVTDGGFEQVNVDTGAALVHGKFYRNTDIENVHVPSSGGAWREDTIFLRAVWGATQTIRIYRHHNTIDSNPYQTPVSTDNVVWHVPLFAVRINNAGAITQLTDLRDYVSDLMQPKQLQVQAIADQSSGATMEAWQMRATAELNGIGQNCAFSFVVPEDFISLLTATIYVMVSNDGTFNWDLDMMAGHCDGAVAAVTGTKAASDQVAVAGILYCLDASSALDDIEAGHHVGLAFTLNAIGACGTVNVATLLIRYR